MSGAPLICGGLTGPGKGSKKCRAYNVPPLNAWTDLGKLYEQVVYPAHSSSENLGLVIMGGNIMRGSAEPMVSNVVTATEYAGYFKFGPPLPEKLHRYALLKHLSKLNLTHNEVLNSHVTFVHLVMYNLSDLVHVWSSLIMMS